MKGISEINNDTKAYVGKLESGIFSTLQNQGIEHIYTNFPEGRIRQNRVAIGGKTPIELQQDLRSKEFNVTIDAKDMIENPDFITQENTENIDLVYLKVADLGLTGIVRTDEIYERAKQLGLDLCPSEVGPQMRLDYVDQPAKEYLYIGTQQIVASDGNSRVFQLSRDGEELWLDGHWAHPERQWNPDGQFVFRLSPPADISEALAA